MDPNPGYPTDKEGLEKYENDLIQEVKDLLAQEWTSDGQNADGSEKRIGTKEMDGLKYYGAKGTLPYSTKQIKALYEDPDFMLGFVDEVSSFKILEKINEDSVIEHGTFKTPFIMSDRDFVTFTMRKIEGDTLYTAIRSVSYPGMPANDDLVRGRTFMSQTAVTNPENPNETHVTTACVTDLSGAIPDWLINQVNKLYLTEINDLKEFIPKYLNKSGRTI
mmetsp:Transcript_94/g.83  ORF Transcript_94/g.83 Transcript_94/m.83 type:complete len:220 (-) Transcript_94:160-819(-)|eukprot:CAMPEP_0114993602 /NCGR_PEP_ID=MMETSP0216-20121206/12628_1 /TAXON_ID=223996 /ORGANISM="Protocruzia adherens, Strain Boccale" /LENGTH=219 /DNA_ID=CAMNT_0002357277 /DNA_START=47 /DNA_END=706 /DNA_ORIENTATION=-